MLGCMRVSYGLLKACPDLAEDKGADGLNVWQLKHGGPLAI